MRRSTQRSYTNTANTYQAAFLDKLGVTPAVMEMDSIWRQPNLTLEGVAPAPVHSPLLTHLEIWFTVLFHFADSRQLAIGYNCTLFTFVSVASILPCRAD